MFGCVHYVVFIFIFILLKLASNSIYIIVSHYLNTRINQVKPMILMLNLVTSSSVKKHLNL